MPSSSSVKHDPKRDRAMVREYFAAASPNARKHLKTIRDAIRAAAPGAVESFSYRIPGFRLDGKALLWYAAFKTHTSLFPIGTALVRGQPGAKGYETAKGTIRFPLDEPPPVALIKRLVKARIAQLRERGR
jgi:uncharacterized protein YdhG (YjbR/CyaY superfamily)